MDELEALEMAEERPCYKFDREKFWRMVMRHQPCYVCERPSVVMVSFKEEAGHTHIFAECQEHWAEARKHPHYFKAEEL